MRVSDRNGTLCLRVVEMCSYKSGRAVALALCINDIRESGTNQVSAQNPTVISPSAHDPFLPVAEVLAVPGDAGCSHGVGVQSAECQLRQHRGTVCVCVPHSRYAHWGTLSEPVLERWQAPCVQVQKNYYSRIALSHSSFWFPSPPPSEQPSRARES